MQRLAAPKGFRAGQIIEGEAAYDYLVHFRERLILAGADAINVLPPAVWIRLIRRFDTFALTGLGRPDRGEESTSVMRIAENLGGSSNLTGGVLTAPDIQFTPREGMRLARLIALADSVDIIEGRIRSATKGVAYRISSGRLPSPHESTELILALQTFDLRTGYRSIERWHDELEDPTSVDEGNLAMLAVYRFKEGFAPRSVPKVEMHAVPFRQFTLRRFHLGDPFNAALPSGALKSFDEPHAVVSVMLLGHALLRWIERQDDETKHAVENSALILLPTVDFATEIEAAMVSWPFLDWLALHEGIDLTVDSLLRNVEALYRPRLRSHPGRVISCGDDHILVDATSLTWHMSVGLQLDPTFGGSLVNASALDFELAVQGVVEKSSFQTPERLLELRGRTLRLNGKAVTDVDAFLVVERNIFLISCKRVTLGFDYLAGDYRTARNAQSRIDEAVKQWAEKIDVFRVFPHGDNYDFTGYQVNGIVVTPELVFTSDPVASETLALGVGDFFLTRSESIDQLAAVLDMAGSHAGR